MTSKENHAGLKHLQPACLATTYFAPTVVCFVGASFWLG